MTVEGIFRKNGNIRRLKDVAEEIDANANVQLTNEGPIQVAALIKKFLRDLPEPLLTFKLYKLFTIVNSKFCIHAQYVARVLNTFIVTQSWSHWKIGNESSICHVCCFPNQIEIPWKCCFYS